MPRLARSGHFLFGVVQRLTWYLGNFLKFLGGGVFAFGNLNRDFGKCELRVWNSVYIRVGRAAQLGVVGDGWGQRHGKNAPRQNTKRTHSDNRGIG